MNYRVDQQKFQRNWYGRYTMVVLWVQSYHWYICVQKWVKVNLIDFALELCIVVFEYLRFRNGNLHEKNALLIFSIKDLILD